jgi:hypothetical protein
VGTLRIIIPRGKFHSGYSGFDRESGKLEHTKKNHVGSNSILTDTVNGHNIF